MSNVSFYCIFNFIKTLWQKINAFLVFKSMLRVTDFTLIVLIVYFIIVVVLVGVYNCRIDNF